MGKLHSELNAGACFLRGESIFVMAGDLPECREMTAENALSDVDRASLVRVDVEIRAALDAVVDPTDSIADALAQFQLVLDRLRLLSLQNAAEMLLSFNFPELDGGRIRIHDDGSAVSEAMSATLHLQSELEQLFAKTKKIGEDSIHPGVRDWVEVIQSAAQKIYDKAEALRWQLLESEADADIAAGRVMNFASPQNAAAFLRRIGK